MMAIKYELSCAGCEGIVVLPTQEAAEALADFHLLIERGAEMVIREIVK